jgi:hypothetical protein
MRGSWRLTVLAFVASACLVAASPPSPASARLLKDAAEGRPLVCHVFVALCDNDNQGIVRVPRSLGNGQQPATNLYWGARYGVRTYLTRDAGWSVVSADGLRPSGVLERLVLKSTVSRPGGAVPLILVADAWDGSRIRETIASFLEAAAGRGEERLHVGSLDVRAGGAAHLVVFLGHNGLMDFDAPSFRSGAGEPARAAAVLACASKPYFEPLLRRAHAEAVLLTTGLMAPEAYTLDAGVREWFGKGDSGGMREAAAQVYDRFQRCGRVASRRLFDVDR